MNKLNCVCTFDTDSEHSLAPLAFTGPQGPAREKLRRAIRARPRTHAVVDDGDELCAERTSLRRRFVDAPECLHESVGQHIPVRSASRVGSSDLGAKRRRVGRI
uniref:DUF1499 domain-containing protein n=1 Tax=Schlesneria paludicola TaxID=360056 RepID=A0A7C2K2D5_9PLAN